MRRITFSLFVLLLLLPVLGCGGRRGGGGGGGGDDDDDSATDDDDDDDATDDDDDDDDDDDVTPLEGPGCASEFTLHYVDGSDSSFTGCADWSIDATFEFDPDDPPEVRTWSLSFSAYDSDTFQCSVVLHQSQACHGELHTAHGGLYGAVTTLDCEGTPDAFETGPSALVGAVRFSHMETGDEPGDLSGVPIDVSLAGDVYLSAPGLFWLEGSFSVGGEIVGLDAEEQNCAGAARDVVDVEIDSSQGVLLDEGGDVFWWGEKSSVHPGDHTAVTISHGQVCAIDGTGGITCPGLGDGPVGPFVDVGARYAEFDVGFYSVDVFEACGRSDEGVVECVSLGDTYAGAVHATGPWYADYDAAVDCGVRWDGSLECGVRFGELLDGAGVAVPDGDEFVALDGYSDGGFDGNGSPIGRICALDSAGVITCFGDGLLPDPPAGSFVQVAVGESHACALDADGDVQCWGSAGWNRTSGPQGRATRIAVGQSNTCMVEATTGALLCWGRNDYAQTSPQGIDW